jgi:uncharacterized protein
MSGAPVIDRVQFARARRRLSGTVAVAELGRLHDLLTEPVGALAYELAGGIDGRQRPYLELLLTGSLPLRCQRCLGTMPVSVDASNRLLLLSSESEFEQADQEGLDAIDAGGPLAVLELIEEELMLALPMVPRHESGDCSATTATHTGDPGPAPLVAPADLKQRRN